MSFFNNEADEGMALTVAAVNALTEIRHRVRKLRCRLGVILSLYPYFSYRLDRDWFDGCGTTARPVYVCGVSARVRRRGGPAWCVGEPSPSLVPDASKNDFC
jgi:hypothetical protein